MSMSPPPDPLPTPRILLGPGPSMADPLVLRAMATPLLGQFDPEFTAIMDEVMALSRLVLQTARARTFPVSGTGRAGLEAAMVSLVEPGDRVVIGGRFGLLLEDLARRCDADVCVVRAEWGQALDPVAIETTLRQAPTKVLAVVHGETSTGQRHPGHRPREDGERRLRRVHEPAGAPDRGRGRLPRHDLFRVAALVRQGIRQLDD